MAESDELFVEVAAVRDEIEEQGAMINALVRASSPELKKTLLDAFEADPALREIYRLIDGKLSQGQIVSKLAPLKLKGASRSAVSNKIDELVHEGLIARVGRTKDGIIYKKSRLDAALGISRALRFK
jgi:hypothetical protein